jgi:CsoR family transcriptional regulator, copper-sensing transcriptional repressor
LQIEGHLQSIETMVQESRYCPDVWVWIAAVRSLLQQMEYINLNAHLTECRARTVEAGNIGVEIAGLKVVLDRFLD